MSNRFTPRSAAWWMMAMASASLLPALSPNRLNPPQPSPATLTLSSVRPSVVYSIAISPTSERAIRRCRRSLQQPYRDARCIWTR